MGLTWQSQSTEAQETSESGWKTGPYRQRRVLLCPHVHLARSV